MQYGFTMYLILEFESTYLEFVNKMFLFLTQRLANKLRAFVLFKK